MARQFPAQAFRSVVLFRRVVHVSIFLWLFSFATPEFSAQPNFNSIAVDDYYVFEKNPLYIAWNDQQPGTVATIVTFPAYGALINNGQTVGYSPQTPGVYVDTFSYKWCEITPPYRCSNTATVTLLVIRNDDSQNFGSCPMRQARPSAPNSVGGPINVTNGNMWLQQRDYRLPGLGDPIEINRFYNSQLEASGLFGYGWTTKYDEFLTLYQDRMVKLTMPDGKAVFFGRPDTSTYFRSISADLKARIDKAQDGSYTLTFEDGRMHKFDAFGRLLWQADRHGNQTTLTYNSNGVLTGITDAGGQVLTLTPNANGKIQQISDSIGTIASYEYDVTGVYLKTVTYPDGSKYKLEYTNVVVSGQTRTFLSTVKDALDNVLETHAYDPQGRATTSELDGGVEKYTLSYPSSLYTIAVDALGRSTKYYFESQQKKKQVTKIEGACSCGSGTETTTFAYNADTLMTSQTDALGHQTVYKYDPERRVTEIVDVLGTQKYTYNSFGQVLTYKDRVHQNTSSNTLVNTYSATGDLLTTTDALGNTTILTYTPLGQLAAVKDARNNTTTLTYDSFGRLTQVKDANNKSTNYAYDARARLTSMTNAMSEITSFEYDPNNRLKKVIHPDTYFQEFTYDLAGRRTAVKDARGNITNYGFDNAYRLTSISDPLNHTTTFAYDLMSNLTSRTDALGNPTNYEYDDFNRLKKIIYPPATSGWARLEESMTYDKLGNVKTRVDTAGRTTSYDYDGASRLLKITDPLQQLTQFEYNLRSQMTKVKDANNQDYVFTYDALGRELSQTRAGSTMIYEYDAVGNRTKRTDYMGRITTYEFDVLDRLKKIVYGLPNGPNLPPNLQATYDYDDLSRLTSAVNEAGTVAFTYDNRNRVKTTTDVFGHVIEYSYDANGNRSQLKLDGVVHTTYNYNAANLLTTLADDASQNFTFTYDLANKLTSRTMPNGVTSTFDYDGVSRLTRLRHQTSAATIVDNNFAYTAANQIGQIAELAQTKTFSYDNVNRLTGMTNGSSSESYTFDGVGNRTASHRSASYSYQPYNRMTATATATMNFDANGNLIQKSEGSNYWRYGWDYENRMTFAATRQADGSLPLRRTRPASASLFCRQQREHEVRLRRARCRDGRR